MNDILERLAHCIAGTVTPEDRDAITLEACAEIARLRLTYAEREAVRWAAHAAAQLYAGPDGVALAATLRGLLDRIGHREGNY